MKNNGNGTIGYINNNKIKLNKKINKANKVKQKPHFMSTKTKIIIKHKKSKM